jgi:hypothetical protein
MITESTRPIPVAVNLDTHVYSEMQRLTDKVCELVSAQYQTNNRFKEIDVCLRGIRGDACFHDMRESLHNISISLEKIANKLHGESK